MSQATKNAGNRGTRLAAKRAGEAPARPDWGFFGPDSVAYQVWSYPTSIALGFSRAVSVEFLDPHLTASVVATDQVMQRTQLRYDRTMQYFTAVLYADAETVLKFSDMLMKIHSRANGHDPVTGKEFDANNPDSQLWIHITAWHSIIKMYEKFGPGKLSRERETEYWADCAKAAEFQTIDPAKVPRSREAVRAYFEDWRPSNTATEGGQAHYDLLVNGVEKVLGDGLGRSAALAGKVLNVLTSRAILSTLPRWANTMGGMRYTKLDALIMATVGTPAVKAFHKYLATHPQGVFEIAGHDHPAVHADSGSGAQRQTSAGGQGLRDRRGAGEVRPHHVADRAVRGIPRGSGARQGAQAVYAPAPRRNPGLRPAQLIGWNSEIQTIDKCISGCLVLLPSKDLNSAPHSLRNNF